MRFKFFILSIIQKIIISVICFSLKSNAILVHGLIIGIKSLVIFLYAIFRPYIHWGFDMFKII
jgi:hypothetical protein